ncbi:MAG: aminotransferase class I/II-fold pyridoxal phosphate-dependent enzyme [Deltaproteobacteria bacterium]
MADASSPRPSEFFAYAAQHGAAQLVAHSTGNSKIEIDDQTLEDFTSNSYFGLERDRRLQAAAHSAMMRFGVQYAAPRAHVSLDLYRELEGLLEQIFVGPTMLAASTTLAHLATLPTLVSPRDLVLMETGVHPSVRLAAENLVARGVRIHEVTRGDFETLDSVMWQHAPAFERVWYLADGVDATFGDVLDIERLEKVRDEHPQLYLYIGDSHGMSIRGHHGRGFALDGLRSRARTIVVSSLSKCFAAAGAAVVFPSDGMKQRVFDGGAPIISSGPLPPPMLGAAIASARIHLADEIIGRQRRLEALIVTRNDLLARHALPTPVTSASPIAFVELSSEQEVVAVANALRTRGYYVHATPVTNGRTGIRFTTTVDTSARALEAMLELLAHARNHLHRTPSSRASSSSPRGVPCRTT